MANECPKCQYQNPDETAFCGKCGTKFDAEIDYTKTLNSHRANKLIAGKYQILEELGKGGMGIVYKAKDIKLDRTVALKFMSPGASHDKEAKKRFIQEAKAASGLDHTNICTIYEIGDTEGEQMYISMPYYEGESLKEKIGQKPLEIDESVSIVTQIAEGLSKAHKKEIVHRDIKPANIMITEEGVVKIVDFGIAKLGGEVRLTQTGSTVGTTAYMSPEQIRGEKVDARSDIWSLGVVLFEMIAGQLPFEGEQMQSMVYSILNKNPEDVTSIRQDVPKHIENVLKRALEKEQEKRFQSVEELTNELKTKSPFTFTKTECSIVVLPFEDMSPKKDNEYFSDGLTEEIITDLSQIQSLCVISRNSAMTLKGTRKNTKTISRELDVQYVLEGSVRKSGNNLRITAQLINARDDVHLWAEKYGGTLDDIFKIQENVSRSIVDALKIRLSLDEEQKVFEKPIGNVQAYECYLKANYEIWRCTEESLSRAIQLLQEGMNIVGENELLSATMGMVYFQYVNVGISADEKYLDKAESYVQKTFKINPDSARGYVLMGMINETRGKFYDAVNDIKKALEINPNDPMALVMLGFLFAIAGKSAAAKPLNDRLKKIDPFNHINLWLPWWIHISEGEFSLTREIVKKMYERDSTNPPIQLCYAWSLVWEQQNKEAFKIIDDIVKDAPQSIPSSFGLFMKHAVKGEKEKAIRSLSEEAVKLAKIDHIYSWFAAQFYSLLDMKEEALDYLENAVNRGRIDYPFLSKRDPFLENIRDQERFKKLMKRVKHEWENFEE